MHFSNRKRGTPKEHFCEIILKSGHLPSRRFRLNLFSILDLAAILISGTILVDGFPRNISVKVILNRAIGLGVDGV